MLPPVRCFSCNKYFGNKYETYIKYKDEYENIFEKLKIKRYCCKRIFLGHINIIDNILEYDDINEYKKVK